MAILSYDATQKLTGIRCTYDLMEVAPGAIWPGADQESVSPNARNTEIAESIVNCFHPQKISSDFWQEIKADADHPAEVYVHLHASADESGETQTKVYIPRRSELELAGISIRCGRFQSELRINIIGKVHADNATIDVSELYVDMEYRSDELHFAGVTFTDWRPYGFPDAAEL